MSKGQRKPRTYAEIALASEMQRQAAAIEEERLKTLRPKRVMQPDPRGRLMGGPGYPSSYEGLPDDDFEQSTLDGRKGERHTNQGGGWVR